MHPTDFWLRLATTVATVLGFVGVMIQIQLQRRDTRTRFLSELDQESNSFADIHQKLMGGAPFAAERYEDLPVPERAAIHSYLAFFERVELCLESGAVDEISIRRLFGFRLRVLFAHPMVEQILRGPMAEHFVLARLLQRRLSAG